MGIPDHGISPDVELPDQIIEGLYLGDEEQACNFELLNFLGITHVLTIQPKDETNVKTSTLVHKFIEITDHTQTVIRPYFQECNDFIAAARKTGKILVHCHAGISRSPTIVMAYLMSSQKLSLACAHDLVRSARPFIWPNAGFRKQLQEFEHSLLASGAFM
eukprot:TRINITY_DN22319_c0_g1_i1.p1 TRINITY_DN22319_c0_g1~~TRINITY_DN22319_c0_g1_i1.p1  ORF type:complete len:161 (-),score=14.58 TRINITY_DN22319_c0_g1_i1:170-652(-)